jgi:hypothetical protein
VDQYGQDNHLRKKEQESPSLKKRQTPAVSNKEKSDAQDGVVMEDWIHKPAVGLTWSFALQSLEKMFLTEGEKLVLKFTESLVHQGVYSVVHNLGSLVVRMLFQPIEEMSFTLFSKLLGHQHSNEDTQQHKGPDAEGNAEIHRQNVQQSGAVLALVLKFMILFGKVTNIINSKHQTSKF